MPLHIKWNEQTKTKLERNEHRKLRREKRSKKHQLLKINEIMVICNDVIGNLPPTST